MARTKTPKLAWGASATFKDPWVIEHERSLDFHGPTASTNHLYPSTVHRGFDSHFTAEPLTRCYPAFEETERHREFLVRSRSDRLLLKGKGDNYFTSEQLWEEDDRLRGFNQSANSGEASWVGKSEDEEEEEEAEGERLGGLAGQQHVEVHEQIEVDPEEDVYLPLLLQADDHAVTIKTVVSEHTNVEDFVTSLNLSSTATLLTTTNAFIDGTLVVALCGHEQAHEIASEDAGIRQELQAATVEVADSARPVRLDTDAAGGTLANPQDGSSEGEASSGEWNVVLKDDHLPTVAFLSGSKNLRGLMASIEWNAETTLATVQKYSDSRILLILVGQQKRTEANKADEIEYASRLGELFKTIQKSKHHAAFPTQHLELASLLETTRKDLVKANLLTEPTVATDSQGSRGPALTTSISDAVTAIEAGQGNLSNGAFIRDLRARIQSTQQVLDLTWEEMQPSLTCSPARMLELLARPSVNYETLKLVGEHKQQLRAAQTISQSAPNTLSAQDSQTFQLAHGPNTKTRSVRPNNISSSAAAGLNLPATSRKRACDCSVPPPDSSPDPQKTKKRKIATARTKGTGKFRGG